MSKHFKSRIPLLLPNIRPWGSSLNNLISLFTCQGCIRKEKLFSVFRKNHCFCNTEINTLTTSQKSGENKENYSENNLLIRLLFMNYEPTRHSHPKVISSRAKMEMNSAYFFFKQILKTSSLLVFNVRSCLRLQKSLCKLVR